MPAAGILAVSQLMQLAADGQLLNAVSDGTAYLPISPLLTFVRFTFKHPVLVAQ